MKDKKKCMMGFFSSTEEKLKTYTCHEVRLLAEHWKKEFANVNAVNLVKPDRYYIEYCKQIDDFLEKCPHG